MPQVRRRSRRPLRQKPETVVIAGREYLTFPEGLAQQCQTSPRTARRWQLEGLTPPVIKVGNLQLIDIDDILPWLQSRKVADEMVR